MHLNIAFSQSHKTPFFPHQNVEHEVSFSMMYNMLGIEYEKVEIHPVMPPTFIKLQDHLMADL